MAGPYPDAELDAQILRIQSSDWSFVATRIVMLTATFFFMARAITQGATAGLLLLPLAVEFTTIMWLGLVIGYVFVDCPKFTGTTRRPGRVVFWTGLLVATISLVLGWEPGGGFDAGRIGAGWVSAWHEVFRTGLIWAMVVEVLGLVVSTAREVIAWRRERGVFHWSSVFAPSFRIAVVMLIVVFSPFVVIPLGDSLAPWLLETRERMAWAAFAFLLLVEAGGLAIGVGLHRNLKADAVSPAR